MASAAAALQRYGTGAGASRLLGGQMDVHEHLEASLARCKGTEAALVFPTGYMANVGVLSALGEITQEIIMSPMIMGL